VKQRAFLAAFAVTGNIGRAAAAAGIDRSTHHRWMREDSAYAESFKQATEEAAGVVEDIAVQRATEGLDEPIIYQGELVYKRDPETGAVERDPDTLAPIPLTIRRRSDTVLLAVLKAWKPDKYRENHHIDADVRHTGAANMTDAELERIARGGDAGAGSGGAAPPADSAA
jgi:hypothetical protein